MYRLLLVEDDPAMRFIYSKMKVWAECGFTIAEEARNGKHALEILARQHFDLVITDIRMPFLDGIELLRKMKGQNLDTCVIFASSYDDFEYARQGLILGAFDYILKPVEELQLKEALTRAKEKIKETKKEPGIEPSILAVLEKLKISIQENLFLQKVCRFLSDNYGKILTMDETAAYFNFNKDYFGKMFKREAGVTFHYFYSFIKIEYAKELLKTGNYKAYQVSEILGYSSTDYFTKIFRDITGQTPSQYKSNSSAMRQK